MMATCQKAPEGIELLLCMGHIFNLLLCVVNALADSPSQLKGVMSVELSMFLSVEDFAHLLQHLCEVIFLGRRVAARGLVLGVGLDVAVRIQAANNAVGLA